MSAVLIDGGTPPLLDLPTCTADDSTPLLLALLEEEEEGPVCK